jgi:hypothetical protein
MKNKTKLIASLFIGLNAGAAYFFYFIEGTKFIKTLPFLLFIITGFIVLLNKPKSEN